MKITRLAYAILPTLLFATQAIAAPKPAALVKKDPVPFPVQIEPLSEPIFTPEEFQKEMKAIGERSKRSVASGPVTEMSLSVQFRNLRNELIGGPKIKDDGQEDGANSWPGISDSDKLYEFYSNLDNDSIYRNPNTPQDYKFAAAQLATLKVFKGFYNRCMDLFQGSNLTHGATVTGLRAMASGVMTFLPDPQWRAGLHYLAYPAPELPQIDRIHAFHVFLDKELIPALKRAGYRISQLNFSQRAVYFDNSILVGKSAKISDDRDRFIRLGEPERKAVLAAIWGSTSGALSLTSYWLGGLFEVIEETSKEYGIGQAFNPDGASAAKRIRTIDKFARKPCKLGIKKALSTISQNLTPITPLGQRIADRLQKEVQKIEKRDESCEFLTIREGGKTSMKDAYTYLEAALGQARLSWEELGSARSQSTDEGPDGQPNTRNIFDPRLYAPFNRVANANLAGLEYVVTGKGGKLVSAVVATEDLEVDLKKFFLGNKDTGFSPPTELRIFLPTHFSDEAYEKWATINGKRYKWHDFRNGTPDAWDDKAFGQYIRTVKSSDDVRKAARIAAQSWGGWLVGIPLGALMF